MPDQGWPPAATKRLERPPDPCPRGLDERYYRLRSELGQRSGRAGSGSGSVDDFNRMQIAAREGKTPADLVSEIRANFEKDISAVRAASDDLIKKYYRAPWHVEGGDIIVGSLNGHMGMHRADLRSAAR